jgi:hypothetical protein
MTEAEWLTCDDPDAIREHLRDACERLPPDRKLRLLACACCRRVIDRLPPPYTRDILQDAERMAEADPDAIRGHHKGSSQSGLHPARLPALYRAVFFDRVVGYAPAMIVDVRATLEDCRRAGGPDERSAQAALCRCVLGDPFAGLFDNPTPTGLGDNIDDQIRESVGPFLRPPIASWRTDTALTLARQMYDARDFSAMPILADALQDAGCDSDDVLNHCRRPGPHVRGCWVCDLVLGKE